MGDRKESVYGEKRGSRKGNRKRRIEWEEKRRQKEEREKNIRESRYNRWYKEVIQEEISEYIRVGRKEESWKRVARLGFGSGIR